MGLALGISMSTYRYTAAFSQVTLDNPYARKLTDVHFDLSCRRNLLRLSAALDESSFTNVDHEQRSQTAPKTNQTEAQEIRRRVVSFLLKEDFEGGRDLIMGMLEFLDDEPGIEGDSRAKLCAAVDEAFQAFYNSAFAPPYRWNGSKSRISLGVDLLNSQFSSSLLPPYNSIPKPVLLSAMKALTGINEVTPFNAWNGKLDNADMAFRILQRLVTGVGLRDVDLDRRTRLYEKDFNLVLNAYTKAGRMDMAHRIVALQERTPNAPGISPVTFSILLKGYGKLGDLYNVEMLLGHAEASGVESDTIMLNSLIDAYVNCGELERAQEVFHFMKNPSSESGLSIEFPVLFDPARCPPPNIRTYNIILKGLASRGLYTESRALADEIETKNIWDHVTTNTLVQAAIKAQNFDAAEEILEMYTVSGKGRNGSHPNAEAYTSAVDGFAKNDEMAKAATLLKTMKLRGVEPNEFTYTCLIGALAKSKRVDQATKMFRYMKSVGLQPRVVTYNAFISGLVHRDMVMDGHAYDRYVDEAVALLKDMMLEGIRPNPVTISVLVGAFAKCDHPRVLEALALVDKLERDQIISHNHVRISTALIQVLGAGGDIDAAIDTFHRIRKPDVPAINSLLDVYVRNDMDKTAVETFQQFFQGAVARKRPDVISYSTMITSALKALSYDGSKEARRLYEEMKYRRRIMPDNALVDM